MMADNVDIPEAVTAKDDEVLNQLSWPGRSRLTRRLTSPRLIGYLGIRYAQTDVTISILISDHGKDVKVDTPAQAITAIQTQVDA